MKACPKGAIKPLEELPDEPDEELKYIGDHKRDQPWLTGYFRDGFRRIDLVLVFKATAPAAVEAVQLRYLLKIRDAGIVVEVEPGIHYDDLIFIKLHLPIGLMEEYGTYFGVRKFFKANHMQYMQEGIKNEVEFINLARGQYPSPGVYSTLERSQVLYKLLRILPIGGAEEVDIYGLDRLLRDEIVWDAFALHDGPYFLLKEQPEETVTARQSLYYGWVPLSTMHRGQPLHLIREYFGERLGFAFAFYEAMLKLFVVLSVFGLLGFLVGLITYDTNHGFVNYSACNLIYKRYYEEIIDPNATTTTTTTTTTVDYDYGEVESTTEVGFDSEKEEHDPFVCPKCRNLTACPQRSLSDYCFEVHFKNRLDSPACAFAALCIAVIGWLFFFQWWRTEQYLMWIWEVPRERKLNPPHFTLADYRRFKAQNMLISRMPRGRSLLATLARVAISIAAIAVQIVIVLVLVLFNYKIMRMTRNLDSEMSFQIRTYAVYTTVGVMNAGIINVLEVPYRWLAYTLTNISQPRNEEKYEWSFVTKWALFSFASNFALFYFFGLVKGAFYTHPADLERWDMFMGFGVMNCGVLGCLDELCVVIVATVAARRCFSVFGGIVESHKTDYSFVDWPNECVEVPCWEREYSLEAVEEDAIMDMFHTLILKYVLSTFFVAIIPLAPLVNLTMLLFDIRAESERMLLRRRRPLLTKFHGLGVWRYVLALIPLGIGLSNALVFAFNTNMFERLLYKTVFGQEISISAYLPEYSLSYYDSNFQNINESSDFEWNRTALRNLKLKYNESGTNFCLFPGKYEYVPVEEWNEDEGEMTKVIHYIPTQIKHYINWMQVFFIFIYQGLLAVSGAALWYVCWEDYEPSETDEWQALEEDVRNYTLEMEELARKKEE